MLDHRRHSTSLFPIPPEGLRHGEQGGPGVPVVPGGGLAGEHVGGLRAGAEGRRCPAEPDEVVGRPLGGHAREAAQEALEALVQGVDCV